MSKNMKFLIAGLLILSAIPTVTVFADSESVKKSISSLVSLYMQKSSRVESISLNADKQTLNDYTITNSIAEIEVQIESNNNNIKKLESGQGSGLSSEQQYQADYQRVYGYELEMKLELYKMQEKFDLLYSEYSEKITEQQNKQLEFGAYTLLWNIRSKKSENAYFEGLTRKKVHELSVMRETYKLGYATEGDVLAAEAELEQVKAQLSACENDYTVLKKEYELGSGESPEQFSAEYDETSYSVEDVLKAFEQNSFYSEYYSKQAEIYQDYADELVKLKKEMAAPAYNQEYFERVQEYISSEAAYYGNEAAIAENNSKRYSEELGLFVYEICGDLNSLIAQRKADAAALKTAEKQLEISRALLEEGRINETALMEAENSVLKLKAELSKVEAEVMSIKFVIDNTIENFE